MDETIFYRMTADSAAALLKSDMHAGLDKAEAAKRLSGNGPNLLREKDPIRPLDIFLEQFKDFIVWILLGAATVSGFLGEWIDASAIIAVVVLNAVLGFIQEYRAERSLAALKKLSSPFSKVVRSGERVMIPSSELVVGDIVELEAGDHIPADGRIFSVTPNFAVQESSLTGESTPVMKTVQALSQKEVALADRANMVYMGTAVSAGKARILVVYTGMHTELGKIAGMLDSVEAGETPLQRKLDEFGRWIVYLCIVLVSLVFLLEWLRGGKLIDTFLTAVSLAVAAIPEGLAAVVTIALALGVQRMVKRHALIRKLQSVETLGCATVICSDKTGTLTKNEMTVKVIYTPDGLFELSGTGYLPEGKFSKEKMVVDPKTCPGLLKSLECGMLCNGASVACKDGVYSIVGDPTEGAILVAAMKAGMERAKLEEAHKFIEEIPFDPERKKMTIVRRDPAGATAFVKGAPDILLKDCAKILENGKERPITVQDMEKISAANDSLSERALRVLALAYRRMEAIPESYEPAGIETGLVFTGLMAMMDPPREEVKEAIALCKSAHIRTVMITGDHKNTAVAIARELGFFGKGSTAFTGEELDRLSDEELAAGLENITVYARVSPEHKLRVVRAWRKRGDIVAMTGDGVNDAPAVKEADIGVAMGITGTDVTKEVSDMVVTDDNFASIVSAVEEGRSIYDNIKKSVHYLLSCNAGEILVMFTASLIGFPVPLLPIHILWVNLVTDSLPALALGIDPADKDIMSRPPRDPKEAVVTAEKAAFMLLEGAFIAFCSLFAFWVIFSLERGGLCRARTGAFIVLSVSQLFHSFNCRNASVSLFRLGVFTNKKLIMANVVSFFLQVIVVTVPFLQKIFKTGALGVTDWILVILVSSFPLWAMEFVKLVNNRYRFLKGL